MVCRFVRLRFYLVSGARTIREKKNKRRVRTMCIVSASSLVIRVYDRHNMEAYARICRHSRIRLSVLKFNLKLRSSEISNWLRRLNNASHAVLYHDNKLTSSRVSDNNIILWNNRWNIEKRNIIWLTDCSYFNTHANQANFTGNQNNILQVCRKSIEM